MTELLLKAARAYVKRGISVLPVNPLGHEKPKAPALDLAPRWKEYQERLPTDDELLNWYSNGSKARLAIIGGKVSRGLVILDIDNLDLAARVREDDDFMDGQVWASTPSGGLHIYLRTRDRVRTRPYPSPEDSCGEIRSEGGYVVAPPSQGYRWEQNGSIPIVDNWDRWFNDFCARFDVDSFTKAGSDSRKRHRGSLSARIAKVISQNRHVLINQEATRLHYKGLDEEEIFDELMRIDQEKCQPPLGEYEIRRQARWAAELPEKKQYQISDIGNGQRFVARYSHILRYTKGQGWFIWTGKRWAGDDLGQVYELAKETAVGIADESDNESVQKWARTSQSVAKLDAMIKSAKSDPAIAVSDNIFDSDPWLLNCANGTLDLRTGLMHEHRQEDFITKQIAVNYEDADGPLFTRFIRQILPDPGTREFVQRLFGYSLTGDVREQIFPIFYGPGGNGKSTLNNAILDILGDYAKQAPTGMFMSKRGENSNSDELALSGLQGTRVVFVFETQQEGKLQETLVKQATGGDKIRARKLYHDYFEFYPSHHLFLVTNHLPVITGGDEGIWRRIRQVPFNVKIEEGQRNKELPKLLKEEYPYILKWLVQGCNKWMVSGLTEPEQVVRATAEYKSESDLVSQFIEASCSNSGRVDNNLLYQAYQSWATASGEYVMSQNLFTRRLGELGHVRKKSSGRRYWIGLSLKSVRLRRTG